MRKEVAEVFNLRWYNPGTSWMQERSTII